MRQVHVSKRARPKKSAGRQYSNYVCRGRVVTEEISPTRKRKTCLGCRVIVEGPKSLPLFLKHKLVRGAPQPRIRLGIRRSRR
jgi:hypothetical protein